MVGNLACRAAQIPASLEHIECNVILWVKEFQEKRQGVGCIVYLLGQYLAQWLVSGEKYRVFVHSHIRGKEWLSD